MKKIKFICISLALFTITESSTAYNHNLKIISFNVNNKLQYPHKQKQINKLLLELNADIVCLQEVNQKYQAARLAKALKIHWNEKSWHTGGMTIFSKHQITDYLTLNIPDSYYNALVAIKTKDVWVCSLHLSSGQYKVDDTERLRELDFILDNLKAKDVILAGDFNSLEESDVSQLLSRNNFIDTHKDKSWSKSTWMPSKEMERIDRIHIRGNFEILNGKVIDHNDIEWLKKKRWPTGNDHRLVMTEISIKD